MAQSGLPLAEVVELLLVLVLLVLVLLVLLVLQECVSRKAEEAEGREDGGDGGAEGGRGRESVWRKAGDDGRAAKGEGESGRVDGRWTDVRRGGLLAARIGNGDDSWDEGTVAGESTTPCK